MPGTLISSKGTTNNTTSITLTNATAVEFRVENWLTDPTDIFSNFAYPRCDNRSSTISIMTTNNDSIVLALFEDPENSSDKL